MEPAGVRAVRQPRMTDAHLVGDDVEHHLEALLMSLANELLELGHVAQMRIDGVRVEGPIAVISTLHLHSDRRDPDRGHPETLDVVELVDHTLQIAALPRVRLAGNAVEIVGRIAVAEAVGHHHVDGLVPPVDRRDGWRRRHQARDDDNRREDRVHAGTRTAASRAPTGTPPLTRFRVSRSPRLPSGRHTSVGKSPASIATYISPCGASGGASGPVGERRYA